MIRFSPYYLYIYVMYRLSTWITDDLHNIFYFYIIAVKHFWHMLITDYYYTPLNRPLTTVRRFASLTPPTLT
jgi:hypothetical protein